MSSKTDQLITETANRLADMIENGAGQWLRPWTLSGMAGMLTPTNATTQQVYRGFNIIRLAIDSDEKGYSSHTWATYKQWQSIGAQVREKEHGTKALKWVTPKRGEKPEPGETVAEWTAPGHSPAPAGMQTLSRPRLVPVTFTLFAAEQVDGYALPVPEPQAWQDHDGAEQFIAATGAEILHGGNSAHYAPVQDHIALPHRSQFPNAGAYYATALHELVHWTKHETRTGRTFKADDDRTRYALEELTAELGAAALCARFGIETDARADHAAYLAHYVRALRETPKVLVSVASKVSDAVDHLNTYQQARETVAA